MELKEEIEKGFNSFIKDKFPEEQVQKFLLRHERKELLQKNLLKQLKKSYHVIKDIEVIRKTIKDFTNMFCRFAILERQKEDEKTNLIKIYQ